MPTPASDDVGRPDLVLLLSACAARLNDEVLARVRAEVGDDVTYRDGYVFQHLVPGPRSVTALGAVLGVTQQAASKQVADLETRGLVDRRPDPHDARARLVSLTRRGWRAVDSARAARAAIVTDLETSLGTDAVASLDGLLGAVSEATGALDHLMARRLRPESSR